MSGLQLNKLALVYHTLDNGIFEKQIRPPFSPQPGLFALPFFDCLADGPIYEALLVLLPACQNRFPQSQNLSNRDFPPFGLHTRADLDAETVKFANHHRRFFVRAVSSR